MLPLWLYSRHCRSHGNKKYPCLGRVCYEAFVTKLRVIFIILPMILMCFFALLSEIRYANLHCCS